MVLGTRAQVPRSFAALDRQESTGQPVRSAATGTRHCVGPTGRGLTLSDSVRPESGHNYTPVKPNARDRLEGICSGQSHGVTEIPRGVSLRPEFQYRKIPSVPLITGNSGKLHRRTSLGVTCSGRLRRQRGDVDLVLWYDHIGR